MFIYIVILIYLLSLFYSYDIKNKDRYSGVHYALACCILIFVAGIRYRIGFDTTVYMNSFNLPYFPRFEDFSWFGDYGADIGWVFINSIAKTVGGGFYTVQFIQAIIVNVTVFWFIKRHSPKPFMAILLFFIFQWWNYCFEAMRESIAIAFYLIALDALIKENSFRKYYLRVWPAALVHTFGFITFIFPFIKYIKVNKYLPIIFIVFLGFFFSISDILNEMVENMSMVDSMATTKATKYIESDIYGESNLSLMGVVSLVLSRIIPMVYLVWVLHKSSDAKARTFVPYLICYILVVLLRMQVPIFFRFYNYFEVMMIIAMTQAVSLKEEPKSVLKTSMTWFMIVFMVFIRTYELTKPESDSLDEYKTYNRYVPYNSIFTEDYNEESEYIFRTL